MTNLTSNLKQMQDFARDYGLPADKKRAVVREYLQSKIIALIYREKIAQEIYFVGGTALHLLYGLDRFSEDLDFDVPEISRKDIKNLLRTVSGELKKENFRHDFYTNLKENKDYFELRFPEILSAGQVSADKDEKLMIKLDFEASWGKQTSETVFLNRFGFLASVVTKTQGQFMVEKLAAVVGRAEIEGRDIYDLVWLYAQGARPDAKFAKNNGYDIKELIKKAQEKYSLAKLSVLKLKLAPFLLNEAEVARLDFFPLIISL
ncbi:MAG: nucleotidyl transferase AbiEii/AbiGii toxin family protein [Patescibacteria group bacterium]